MRFEPSNSCAFTLPGPCAFKPAVVCAYINSDRWFSNKYISDLCTITKADRCTITEADECTITEAERCTITEADADLTGD